MVARTPNERTQARTSRSEPALVELYGLDGLYGDPAVNLRGSSSGRSPYTSSVEMWWKRTSWRRTASSRVNVPTRFVCTNGVGSDSELSLCDSAAKWTTTSAAATNLSTTPASAMSPGTKSIRSATGAKLASVPAYVSASRTVTCTSGWVATVRCTKLAPMNPAPPVTRTRMRRVL